MTPHLPFHDAETSHQDFQYLEDLSTAYWYSQVLFAAIELRLFEHIEKGCDTLALLARAAQCREPELLRFLNAMRRLGLVLEENGFWRNREIVRTYLLPGRPSYMGDFLLYRHYLQPRWETLVKKLCPENPGIQGAVSQEDDYETRTFHYVQAMDQLAVQKAREITVLMAEEIWDPPVLDVGGGAGTLSRALIRTKSEGYAVLFDLPEVIRAAKSVYPDDEQWERFHLIKGDFRSHEFGHEERFGLIVLGNFLHTYASDEAQCLLTKALELLTSDGMVLIHDYFPDRRGRSPQKGPLYDLNMMLNTYNGECHKSSQIADWLCKAGMERIEQQDLSTDSSIILASRNNKSDVGQIRNLF